MIEVGEYIRTHTGKIAKANIINNVRYTNWSARARGKIELAGTKRILINGKYELEDILKHSKNIIDLIEIGDYVNGYRVLEKTKIKNNEMQICILKDNNCSNWRTVNDKTLKSIVTKEQFASMEYRAEEE